MNENNGGSVTYKVSRQATVPADIRAIAALAKQQGKLARFIEILKTAMHHLERRPLEWGDPRYNLAHPGGVVCHAMILPICFGYAVFPDEHVVVILEVWQVADYVS
jgi:hypothetical protein